MQMADLLLFNPESARAAQADMQAALYSGRRASDKQPRTPAAWEAGTDNPLHFRPCVAGTYSLKENHADT